MPADTFTRRKPGRPASPENDWAQWTNGEVWHIFPGRDFQVTVKRKQQQLKKYAYRHKLHVETWTETNDEGVVRLSFRFSEKVAAARPVAREARPVAREARPVTSNQRRREAGNERARRLPQALAAQAHFPTVLGGSRPVTADAPDLAGARR